MIFTASHDLWEAIFFDTKFDNKWKEQSKVSLDFIEISENESMQFPSCLTNTL